MDPMDAWQHHLSLVTRFWVFDVEEGHKKEESK
jgi:hypothetical protein